MTSWILLAVTATGATRKPNVLLIIADQWRAQAFGFAGDPNVHTPHLDRLTRESVRFVNAVASVPVCSPTRASLMTGQRALTHGIFMNDVPLAPETVTIAKVLHEAGYQTGYIGKWHLNGDGRSEFIPRERRQGFDYWKALECTHDYNNSAYFADGPVKLKWEGYDAVAQTRDAQAFIRAQAQTAKPFFLVLAWGPPHDPYQAAPEKYRMMYAPQSIQVPPNVPESGREKAQRNMAGYYAHCTALDDCVGELCTTLRETGLEQDTLLIFTSDHGDLLGSHGAYNKQQPYEESIRVPLLLRWPTELGGKRKELKSVISSEDVMPSVLGLCRVAIPASVEGVDFSGYIRGTRPGGENAALICCVTPFGQWTRAMGGHEYRGIRTERYTYVRDLNGPWLLFDNERDPWQLQNLAGDPSSQKLQKRLDAMLSRKLAHAHDEFLPSEQYVKRWGYTVDRTGTVPYRP